MLNKFLISLETPERPLLAPNYWALQRTGLILAENNLEKIVYLVLLELVTLFNITQFIEIYFIRSDLDQVLTNMTISMMAFIMVLKLNSFVVGQKKWHRLLDYVTKADKYERDNIEKSNVKIIESYTKYCRNITYYYWGLVFFVYTSQCTKPLIFLSSADFRQELTNGTKLFPHIMSSWVPFDKYHSPGIWLTIAWQCFVGIFGSSVLAIYDTTILVIFVFFGGKLDLLRTRNKDMLGKLGRGISDEEALRNIHELYNEYTELVKNAKLFNSLLSPVMFMYVVICSLMICATTFQLTTAQTAIQVFIAAVYFTFALAQLFMFCWYSNDVMVKSSFLMYGPYESEWWAANARQRKLTLLLAGIMKPVIIFTAGPFTNLNISTCINILKGAYSYYTLIRK